MHDLPLHRAQGLRVAQRGRGVRGRLARSGLGTRGAVTPELPGHRCERGPDRRDPEVHDQPRQGEPLGLGVPLQAGLLVSEGLRSMQPDDRSAIQVPTHPCFKGVYVDRWELK